MIPSDKIKQLTNSNTAENNTLAIQLMQSQLGWDFEQAIKALISNQIQRLTDVQEIEIPIGKSKLTYKIDEEINFTDITSHPSGFGGNQGFDKYHNPDLDLYLILYLSKENALPKKTNLGFIFTITTLDNYQKIPLDKFKTLLLRTSDQVAQKATQYLNP